MPPGAQPLFAAGAGDAFGRIGRMISSIGGEDFDGCLAEVIGCATAVDQCILFSLRDDGDSDCLFVWSRSASGTAARLAQSYCEGHFFRRDPALRHLQQAEGGGRRVGQLRREQIEDAWYRSYFFDSPRLDGKVVLLEDNRGAAAYLNFYKYHGSEDFSPAEVDHLVGLGDLITRSLLRHRALLGRPATAAAAPKLGRVHKLLVQTLSNLTRREIEVCSRVVAGYSTQAISLDLGIAESSVATYRKRAYAKLGISSQNELFGLCLAAAQEH